MVINKRKDEPGQTIEEKENKRVHTLYNDNKEDNDSAYRIESRNEIHTRRVVEPERKSDNVTQTSRVYNNPFNNSDDDEDFGIKSYVRDAADTQTVVRHEVKKEQNNQLSQQEALRRQRLSSLNNFRSMSYIEELENQPAYKRKGLNISVNNEEQELSNYSFNKGRGISENNSYLHDNVD